MAELAQPTPTQIKAARETVGDTQAQAAARVHSPSYRAWQNWEDGSRKMPLAAWELYLIKTGITIFDTTNFEPMTPVKNVTQQHDGPASMARFSEDGKELYVKQN